MKIEFLKILLAIPVRLIFVAVILASEVFDGDDIRARLARWLFTAGIFFLLEHIIELYFIILAL